MARLSIYTGLAGPALMSFALASVGCASKDSRYRGKAEMVRYDGADVPITGMPISYRFDLSTKELGKASGSARLRCVACTVGDGSKIGEGISPMGGLTIPPIDLGDVEFRAEVAEGLATIRGGGEGDGVAIDLSGTVALSEPIEQSTLSLRLSLQLSSEAPGSLSNLGIVMGRSDGAIVVDIGGTIGAPLLRPER